MLTLSFDIVIGGNLNKRAQCTIVVDESNEDIRDVMPQAATADLEGMQC